MTIKINFPNPFNFPSTSSVPPANFPSTSSVPPASSYPSPTISIKGNTSPSYGVYTDDFVWNTGDYIGDGKWRINPSPDLNVEGDIKMKGRSLTEALDKIEQRLAILKPNPDLEERWEELKELGEKYRELEKEILEKEAMWKILNK